MALTAVSLDFGVAGGAACFGEVTFSGPWNPSAPGTHLVELPVQAVGRPRPVLMAAEFLNVSAVASQINAAGPLAGKVYLDWELRAVPGGLAYAAGSLCYDAFLPDSYQHETLSVLHLPESVPAHLSHELWLMCRWDVSGSPTPLTLPNFRLTFLDRPLAGPAKSRLLRPQLTTFSTPKSLLAAAGTGIGLTFSANFTGTLNGGAISGATTAGADFPAAGPDDLLMVDVIPSAGTCTALLTGTVS